MVAAMTTATAFLLAVIVLLSVAAGVLYRRQAALRRQVLELDAQARWYHDALRIAGAAAWQWDVHSNDWKWVEDVFQARGSTLSYRVAMGDDFQRQVHPDDRDQLRRIEEECRSGQRTALFDDYRYRLDDGTERWLRDIGHMVQRAPGEPPMMVGITLDITHEKQRELEDALRSGMDDLTGLPCRRRLTGELDRRCASTGAAFALAFVDLNGFKQLNDRHGHAAGDACLAAIGRAFRTLARDDEFCARLGGDEFVLLVPAGPEGLPAARRRIEMLVGETLRRASPSGVGLGAAVGIARFPDDAPAPADLMRLADAAMYVAKASGTRLAFSAHGASWDATSRRTG